MKIRLKQESPPAWTQEAYRPLRGKHMLCYPRWEGGYLPWWGGGVPTLVGGGTYPGGGGVPTLGWGGTYPRLGVPTLDWGVPTLVGWYLPWWGGTYPGGGVPTLVGGYLP